MDDDGEQVDLREGMQVSNDDGEELGTLAALLVEDEEDEAEFLILRAAGTERLVPFDAVLGVGDGALIVDITSENLERYPALKPDVEPTDADIERAYDVYEETARYATDEDEE